MLTVLLTSLLLHSCTPEQAPRHSERVSVDSAHRAQKKAPSPNASAAMTPTQSITEVLRAHTMEWLEIPGVVGTAEGRKNGKPAVVIMVQALTPTLRTTLPNEIAGYPVVVEEVGEIKPLKTK